jgi:diguanylate cyclase (GGDEF)-like protein/PAS domain S-box-containing protein
VQRTILEGLARIVVEALLLRENAINAVQDKATMLAAIVTHSDDAIISKTLDGIVTSWNKGAEVMFGYHEQEMIGQSIFMTFPADRLAEEGLCINKIKNNEQIHHFQTQRINKTGEIIDVSLSLSPMKNAMGEITGVSNIIRNISLEQSLKNKILAQHEQLIVTMDSIGDAVITTDNEGLVQYLNPVAQQLTGWSNEEAHGKSLTQVFNIINETTREPCLDPVNLCLKQNRVIGLANHTILIHRNGTEYGIEDSAAPIRDKKGKVLGVVLVFHDVTSQRQMANEIAYRATHDNLTGLINRSEFDIRLKALIHNQRERTVFNALMFIDLDQFKIINDACGHQSGDQVLLEISLLITGLVRNTDTVARIGGDEFAIILTKCTEEKTMQIANDICKLVSNYRFQFEDKNFQIGASIGLVIIDQHWHSIKDIVQAADNACLEAKRTGRNRVHVHVEDDITLENHKKALQWASRITNALENNGFALFAQRILPIQPNQLAHAEILVRMKDIDGELIPPGAFLPAAERFHIISRIDRWVVKSTLEWMRLNANRFNHIETISINLSGQSLVDLTFHEYTKTLVSAIDIDYTKVCFEITETAAITNLHDAKQFIEIMHSYGIKFSLDDFGSGASSFGYLKNLPVDYLKIDGQFIKDLLENEIGQATVRCITEVAKITNTKTIAEWVDNQSVETMLKNMNVDFTQGFFKHKPAPINNMLDAICTYES